MSKSKLEIINETANFYTSENRAVGQPSCMYLTDDGKRCAVGRCLREDLDVKNFDGDVHDLITDFEVPDIDDLLKEKYKGHSEEFWLELQNFHDISGNWNEEGLTEEGYLHVERLKNKWT